MYRTRAVPDDASGGWGGGGGKATLDGQKKGHAKQQNCTIPYQNKSVYGLIAPSFQQEAIPRNPAHNYADTCPQH